MNPDVLLAIVLLPLAAAIIAGLFGRIIGRVGAHTITIGAVGASFVLSCIVLKQILWDGVPTYNAPVYTWLVSDGITAQVGFLIDRLTALMMVVVTFVSFCVHVYTIGYMADDDGYQRFFSYISLFTFSMLMLVMSNNFLQLFFGWEAVGVVSYLLIGFWYTRPSAIFANLKAFIVNRVGDFGFIIGIAAIVYFTNSLDYQTVFAQAPQLASQTIQIAQGYAWPAITVICICLFIGAMGKSAQMPLHVWLPDSMEGPTPISALIHAATMVTAGIFMVARMSPLFEYSDTALSFVLVIGATTAIFCGLLGIVHNDIKRVIAYSTLSQLGYMTVALGASAYGAGIFHLMTHAFFKALLFLAAGSVIIALHHEQDMRKMGGLFKYMKITAITSWIGALALIGTPFFSGFYSKDAHHRGGARVAPLGRALRLLVRAAGRVRHGALHLPPDLHDLSRPRAFRARWHDHKPHESPWVVTVPLDPARHSFGDCRLLHGWACPVRRLLRRLDIRARAQQRGGRGGTDIPRPGQLRLARVRARTLLAGGGGRCHGVSLLPPQPVLGGCRGTAFQGALHASHQQVLLRLVQRERDRAARAWHRAAALEGWG